MRLLLTLCVALLLASCAPALPPSGGTIATFERIDRTVGTGAVATPGAMVTVHYTGWLYDEKAADKHGKKFDSSLDRRAIPVRVGRPSGHPRLGRWR